MVRYFFQSVNVLNALLAAAVAAVGYFAVIPALNPAARVSLPPVKGIGATAGEIAAPSQNFPAADYAVISDQNLFHPERKIPPEKQAEKTIPKPELFLYGTLIAGDTSFAFIEDKKTPHSTPGRGKRQITLKKGDSVSGYTLSEIEANRIVLVKGEERIVVMLDDRGKKRGDDSPLTPATRASAAGVPALPSAPPAAPQTVPAPAPPAASAGPRVIGPSPRPPSPPGKTASPQTLPTSAPDAPAVRPGVGASGTWPPTRSSAEQTQQKIQEGRQMRSGQIQQNK